MKQKTFKQKAKTVAIILHTVQQRTVGLLLILTVLLGVLYIYFLGTAVVHAVERKETQSAIAQASSRIADLEVSYLKGKNKITLDLATDLGFSRIANKEYVERVRYLGRADIQ
ncbi:MAG: hypothetical protein JKX80_01685 [Candidatus Pacebacteria bacterium]|nr:hypothetical protein [Candidatus Paceibacterota bacterium]